MHAVNGVGTPNPSMHIVHRKRSTIHIGTYRDRVGAVVVQLLATLID